MLGPKSVSYVHDFRKHVRVPVHETIDDFLVDNPLKISNFFGRVAAIDDGSLRLDGTLGSVVFVLTDETLRLGFKDAAIGDLVTVVISDGVVQLLIVVG